jgi:lysophospholipase L1-like esterase
VFGSRVASFAVLVATVCSLAGGCGGDSSGESDRDDGSVPEQAQGSGELQIVALGDSSAAGEGDTAGAGWVERYGRLLRHRLDAKVNVTNLAENGKTSDQLLSEVRSDPVTRRQIGRARIILFGIGGADLNAGDEKLAAGRCRGRACYAPVLERFGQNFEATAAAVRKLRGPRQTVLGAITPPNALPGAEDVVPPFVTPAISLYQARAEKQAICRAMTQYEGRCVDLLRAFNGASGTENAYEKGLMNHDNCCYPSAEGQQLIAELVVRTGLAPLE